MAKYRADDKLIVVKHQPGVRRKQRLAMAMVATVAFAVGYVVGNYEIKIRHDRVVFRLDQLSSNYQEARANELSLRQQVANLESGRAIDDLAKQEIKDTIQGLKTSVSQLKKDVSFYKNIMAPSDNAKGLQLQSVEINPAPGSNRFAYKIVLTQVADNKAYVSGVVAVNIIGVQNEAQEVLPLRDISEVEDLGIKFRFRYFQDITGELVLPEGFEPERLQVVAQSKGKRASRLEQSFVWGNLITGKGQI